jgi:hypothetical protein
LSFPPVSLPQTTNNTKQEKEEVTEKEERKEKQDSSTTTTTGGLDIEELGKLSYMNLGGPFYTSGGKGAMEGWKLHISCDPAHPETIGRPALQVLRSHNVRHKVLPRSGIVRYYQKNPDQIGKYITVYPENFEQFKRIVSDLYHALPGGSFDQVKGELQMFDGKPIFTRYGEMVTGPYEFTEERKRLGTPTLGHEGVFDPENKVWVEDDFRGQLKPPWIDDRPVMEFIQQVKSGSSQPVKQQSTLPTNIGSGKALQPLNRGPMPIPPKVLPNSSTNTPLGPAPNVGQGKALPPLPVTTQPMQQPSRLEGLASLASFMSAPDYVVLIAGIDRGSAGAYGIYLEPLAQTYYLVHKSKSGQTVRSPIVEESGRLVLQNQSWGNPTFADARTLDEYLTDKGLTPINSLQNV